jgi:glyceraldehyde-3-phosphate dehydrogenase/erythrose-4-phosphate dehydrogenase
VELTDLALPKKTKKELKEDMAPSAIGSEGPKYPYGLQIRFEAEQIEKLPQLEKVKIGEDVTIEAKGEVTEIRMNEQKEGKKKYTVEIQLKKVAIQGPAGKKDTLIGAIEKAKKGDLK